MGHPLKYARIERERRFLLAAVPPEVNRERYFDIDDLYIAGTRLRLRRAVDNVSGRVELKLNQKLDDGASQRTVTSVYLEEREHALLSTLPGGRITKRRYRHAHRGREFAIDELTGPLTGLFLAEIEVGTDAALRALRLPPFAHCEITELPELTGGALAHTEPATSLAFARRLLDAPAERSTTTPEEALAVRLLESDDPPAIAAALATMGWKKPEAQYARYLTEQAAGTRTVVTAWLGGAFAGYVTVVWQSPYEPFRSAGIPEIQDLNVVSGLRRRGVASALLDEAESRIAQRSPVAGIGVGLHPGYNAAQRLYPLRGYVPDGRGVTHGRRFVREGERVPFDDDLVLRMTKRL
jgi:CYTH domain-containing protein/GNAT superfamily N-acetyltransferase